MPAGSFFGNWFAGTAIVSAAVLLLPTVIGAVSGFVVGGLIGGSGGNNWSADLSSRGTAAFLLLIPGMGIGAFINVLCAPMLIPGAVLCGAIFLGLFPFIQFIYWLTH